MHNINSLPAIHTLTGNLLWEKTLTFPNWTAGRTHRATGESFQVGGKGVNVVRMLKRLGSPTTALIFTGGATGEECSSWLSSKDIKYHAFNSATATRCGFVVRTDGRQPETTFLGPDGPPDRESIMACAEYLAGLPKDDVLALCGSFPGWETADFDPVREAVRKRLAEGSPVVADSYGPPLAWLVNRPLALVKVNRAEFDGLFPESERSFEIGKRLDFAADRWPVHRWIITDGPNPVWFAEKGGAAPTRVTPPSIKEYSATGSGDVLMACVLHALYKQRHTLAEAVAWALPFAAAKAASQSVADFPLPLIN